MSRPMKWRKVCKLPDSSKFGPLDIPKKPKDHIYMTIDEYEAKQINIARTTVQGIYKMARNKLAESLVNGKVLHIEGGEYRLCDGEGLNPHCGPGCRKRGKARKQI